MGLNGRAGKWEQGTKRDFAGFALEVGSVGVGWLFSLLFSSQPSQPLPNPPQPQNRHYLNAQYKDRVGRYVLQENMKPAWHSTKMSPKERIEKAVTDMVTMIEDDTFGKPKQPGDADIQ